MSVVGYFPFFLCLGGGLLYGLSRSSNLRELGRIAFAVGLFFVCAALAGKMWRIG